MQTRLGHASGQMTLDIYVGLWPEDDERTRKAVDSVLGGLFFGADVGLARSG